MYFAAILICVFGRSSMKKEFISDNPRLLLEWHPIKNGELNPVDIAPYSNKKVWWKCEKGHEWETTVAHRTNGTSCPCCSSQRVCDDNSLQTRNPELSKQWHPIKNGYLTPNDVTSRSNKKVWWECKVGHEWQAIVYSRNQGNGCPYCSGRNALDNNCLQTSNPELAKQWHQEKNEKLTAKNVTSGSDKKVWWMCGKGHEWQATVSSRANGRGCPYCSGKRVCTDNSLQALNPGLSKQWQLIKNGDLTPNDVTVSSHKKVWWMCDYGHEWEATIANRTKGRGCPICFGRKKSETKKGASFSSQNGI